MLLPEKEELTGFLLKRVMLPGNLFPYAAYMNRHRETAMGQDNVQMMQCHFF
jgi:hypothetical protein